MGIIKNKFTLIIGNKDYNSREVAAEFDGLRPWMHKESNCHRGIGIGETFTWTMVIKNPTRAAYNNIKFVDMLESQNVYVADTFKVNGVAATPSNVEPMEYVIPTIAAGATLKITFDVMIVDV